MQITGNSQRYGLLARWLHGSIALLLLIQCGLGFYMMELSYYDANYKSSFDLHRSLGVLTALLIVIRLCWVLWDDRPPLAATLKPLERIAAKTVHLLLYLIMVLIPVAGYLVSTADGRGVEVFGWFSIPALLVAEKGREEWAGDLHEGLAILLLVLVVLHVSAALKHHFVDKNNILKRMF